MKSRLGCMVVGATLFGGVICIVAAALVTGAVQEFSSTDSIVSEKDAMPIVMLQAPVKKFESVVEAAKEGRSAEARFSPIEFMTVVAMRSNDRSIFEGARWSTSANDGVVVIKVSVLTPLFQRYLNIQYTGTPFLRGTQLYCRDCVVQFGQVVSHIPYEPFDLFRQIQQFSPKLAADFNTGIQLRVEDNEVVVRSGKAEREGAVSPDTVLPNVPNAGVTTTQT